MGKRADTPTANFDLIQQAMKKDARSDDITRLLAQLGDDCLDFLRDAEQKAARSLVLNKHYFTFVVRGNHSRAVNEDLFANWQLIHRFLNAVRTRRILDLSSDAITRACYTLVMSLACTVDLVNKGDQQTPGTFYEYLVTHLLTRSLDCERSQRVRVRIGEDEVPLTMDLVLDLGKGRRKYNVAVKNSTRERASEIWAHQRILDQAATDKYIGLFFGLAETKLDKRKLEVIEICVPEQWRAYQQYIATLSGVYYLDPPDAYLRLNEKQPSIRVRPFGAFFSDFLAR